MTRFLDFFSPRALMRTFALSFILFVVAVSAVAAPRSGSEPEFFIEAGIDAKKSYAGQWLTLTVTLYSTTENISSVTPVSRPDFRNLAVYDMGGERRLSKTRHKGKDYWSVVVARWCVCASEPGKYSIGIPSYAVGIPVTKIVDSFWGRQRVNSEEHVEVGCKAVDFKVNPIPEVPEGFDFSGAVGVYDIELWIPAGDVVKGDEAVAMVSVSGKGSLQDASIPRVLPAFQSKDIRLKEVSDERKNFIRDGSLNSEIELECSFVPESSGTLEIGAVRFGYFDTETGKYRYAESQPVSFEVSEAELPSSSTPPVLIGI